MRQLEVKIETKIKCHQICFSRGKLSSKVVKYLIEVNRLIESGSFPSGFVVENFQVEKVQHIPGTSILDQSTASKNLIKVLNLLNDDNASIIGVWGMGGVGKTTLVKNLNNTLGTLNDGKHFSIIIWATASKDANLINLQNQLVKRLNMEERNGESKESTASRLHKRLKQEKRFIFILDDVWENIDLYYLGFSEMSAGNKIILTTRSMDVCRRMKTDIEVRVDVLNEDESWQLFMKNVGPVASHEDIEPFARKVNHECRGLPLVVIVVGNSMRGKTEVNQWKDALNSFRKSVPYIEGIEVEVYRPLKWSYDSLSFRIMDVKSCFLYCCLYPEDFSIRVNELVHCWIGEGLVCEYDNYEDMVNTGTSIVKYLKDSCLLEEGIYEDTVKMHDVVRDVAIWIASSLEDRCKSLVRSGSGVKSISEGVFQNNYRRVSLIDTGIGCLPNFSKQYPHVQSLFLLGDFSPEIPEGFFQGLPGLRVLNLSTCPPGRVPFSLGQLTELRTLIMPLGFYTCTLPPLSGLHSLEVLDFPYSFFQTFPEGMEKLTNLRVLNLYRSSFEHFRDGVISKLTRLESLNMTESMYMWDADVVGAKPLDELQSLDQLRALSISVKMSSSSTVDFSWLTRVESFLVIVGEFYERCQPHEKKYERSVVICKATLNHILHCSCLDIEVFHICFSFVISRCCLIC